MYGGTKTEMERLLKDAQKLSGVEYDISNLGDVYDAIHVIQEDLGLTGVAAQEASETFTGSFGAMKASAKNLLANMALGQDIKGPLTSLLGNTKTFLMNNFLPMIGNILKSVPTIIGTAFEFAISEIPQALSSLFTAIQTTAATMLSGEGGGLFDSIKEAFVSIDWEGAASTAMELLSNGITFVSETIPQIIQAIGLKAINFFQSIDWVGLGQKVINFIVAGIQILAANIPTYMQNIGKTAMALFRAINWIQLGRTVITLIKSGIQALFTIIPTLLKSIGQGAINFFKAVNWKEVGRTVINLIKMGINALRTAIPAALKAIGTSAMNGFKSINWASVGWAVINGIKSGISALASSLLSSIRSLGSMALGAIKGILGIHSPSKAFAEVGRDMALGIEVGWEKNLPTDEMVSDAENMTKQIAGAASYSYSPGSVRADTPEGKLDAILEILAAYIPGIANRDVVLDNGKLVGALAPEINRKLGVTMGW